MGKKTQQTSLYIQYNNEEPLPRRQEDQWSSVKPQCCWKYGSSRDDAGCQGCHWWQLNDDRATLNKEPQRHAVTEVRTQSDYTTKRMVQFFIDGNTQLRAEASIYRTQRQHKGMHRGTHNTKACTKASRIKQRHAEATRNTQRHTDSKAFNRGT